MTGTAIVVGLVLVFFALLFTLPDRDRTRVNLYNKLQSLGVSARIEERGHQAEQISRSRKAERWELRGHSLGVIEITGGPIRWVNVKRYGADQEVWYGFEYAIPDVKVSDFPPVRLKLVRSRKWGFGVKDVWGLGPVKEVWWNGKDFGLGIIERLSRDASIANAVQAAPGTRTVLTNLEIDVDKKHGYWILTGDGVGKRDVLSSDLWHTYKKIALHLLAASRREGQFLSPSPAAATAPDALPIPAPAAFPSATTETGPSTNASVPAKTPGRHRPKCGSTFRAGCGIGRNS